jgi:hypothetical protein
VRADKSVVESQLAGFHEMHDGLNVMEWWGEVEEVACRILAYHRLRGDSVQHQCLSLRANYVIAATVGSCHLQSVVSGFGQ